jgi:hypothetical protein
MSEYGLVPPILCLVALPESDGEETYRFLDQFTVLEVDEQLLQIDQLGERSAYPGPQLFFCRLQNLW